MLAHPDLGFVDSGVDFLQPELYAACRTRFGIASALPRRTYTSPVFQQLENEKVWTRDWICIGTAPEIANPHDLLPYTIGQHAIHVQRTASGGLIGRFNKAQHGGCRAIPAQCQTGRKTKCSYTSCGFSRDRDVIAGELFGEMTPQAGQYLGVYPERLLPVSVETRGPLIFANIDPTIGRTSFPPSIESAIAPDMVRVAGQWRECRANWKIAGAALVDAARSRANGGGASNYVSAEWHFPNLVIIESRSCTIAVVLQPTAFDQSLWRISAFSRTPSADPTHDNLLTLVDHAATAAAKAHDEVERSSACDITETSRAAWSFNLQLLDRVSAVHPSYWNAPLTRARAGL